MVVLRVGNPKQWSDDYRRSVCAVISETHAKRAVYLYTMSDRIQVGSVASSKRMPREANMREQYVPPEFQAWVLPMNDNEIRANNPSYRDGHFNGDMAVAHMMLALPHSRAWVLEDDCRLVSALVCVLALGHLWTGQP